MKAEGKRQTANGKRQTAESAIGNWQSEGRPATRSSAGYRLLAAGCLVVLFTMIVAGCSGSVNQIVVGSKNFTEQVILGELLAQHIESHTDLKVDRRLNLGGTFVCHQALTAGELDLYVEYTGTAFTAIMKHKPVSDPDEIYRRVKTEYAQRLELEWTEPLGFNNTFAIIVRGEDARQLGLKTISQAAQYTPRWRAGFGHEFIERADGFPGLANTYGLKFADQPSVMDIGLMYRALRDHKVDLVAGNSTDGLIDSLDLFVLEDDRQYFPPYQAAPVVRKLTLEKHPELRQALRQLGGLIPEETMRRLNYQVDGEHRDVKQVVLEFLRSKGL